MVFSPETLPVRPNDHPLDIKMHHFESEDNYEEERDRCSNEEANKPTP